MGNIFNRNLRNIRLNQIKPNPDQPRKFFDEKSLDELSQSIRRCGVINPISVKKINDTYQIIAGERRYRACILAGLSEIPCIVMTRTDEEYSSVALIENIQRCDLDFIEEAFAYKKFIDDFGYKQEELATKLGKTQSAIANKLRILKLSNTSLVVIKQNNLTERHARAILRLPENMHASVLEHIIKFKLNVAKTDEFINKLTDKSPEKSKKKPYFKVSKDVRLFINSMNKYVKNMQESGIKADINKTQDENFLTYTIVVPVRP